MRATRPLFRLDPGWLFILAGLVVCAAGVLLPAQADLRALGEQLEQLQAEEARAYQRLAAHADFIDQVERGEPAMIRRLATAQLNLVPASDTPLLLAAADAAPVTGWIDATVHLDLRPSKDAGMSTLSRWASGPSRLWLFGGGILSVFVGLLVSPGPKSPRAKSGTSANTRTTVEAESAGDSFANTGVSVLEHHHAPDTTPRDQADLVLTSASRIADELEDVAAIHTDDHDLVQMLDTVDLEEAEVLPVKRSVIEDDPAHDAERDHAAEVIVQAREISLQLRDEAQAAASGLEPHGRQRRQASNLRLRPASSSNEADEEGISRAESDLLLDDGDGGNPIPEAADATAKPQQGHSRNQRKKKRNRPNLGAIEPGTAEHLEEAAAIDDPSPDEGASPSPVSTDEVSHEDHEEMSIPFLRFRRDRDDGFADDDADD